MNKEKITVTLSLAEFDELRQSEHGLSKLYNSLTSKLKNCFGFDTSEYDAECRKIDNGPLQKDKEIFAAVKAAQSLIVVTVDMEKLKAIVVDFYDEDIDPKNISKISLV